MARGHHAFHPLLPDRRTNHEKQRINEQGPKCRPTATASEREIRIAHRVHGFFLKFLYGLLLGIHGPHHDGSRGHRFPLLEFALFLAQIAGAYPYAFLRLFRRNGAGVFTRPAADAQGGVQLRQAVFLAVAPDVGHRVKRLGRTMFRTAPQSMSSLLTRQRHT